MIIVRKNYMNKKPAHLRKVEPVVFYSICDVPIFLNRAYLCSVSSSSESIRFFSKVLPISRLADDTLYNAELKQILSRHFKRLCRLGSL